ncbi:MAG: class I SAM-dependent methyltransferase, partial [Gammaproteobacteria bacterium]|nr:class I SAM-dependent methyltransferase [Gammaproteobacteria bacterium]
NEDGGRRWVEHIDQLERMLDELSGVLVAAVDARSGERVLDVGCGGGPTSAHYASVVGRAGEVLGVDISAVILEVARRRFGHHANLHFELADAGSHAFPPARFDVLTSRFGVMFFADPVAAFTNLRQALRPGGRLCFMCWRGIDENPWMGVAAAAAFTVIPPPPKPAPGTPGPFALGRRERLEDILGAAGFADLSLEGVERDITLGPLDEAVEWLTRMGPAAGPLAEAEPAAREAAIAAMRDELARHQRGGAVVLPGATWLVRAQVG